MWPTVVGTVAAVTAVLAEARLGPRNPDTLNPSSWWGILPSGPPSAVTRGWLAAIAAVAVLTLCLCWYALVRSIAHSIVRTTGSATDASGTSGVSGVSPGGSGRTRRPARLATTRVTAAWVVVTSLGWNLPFALGPPLFSRDVYAYAGQGELARHGLDPATHGISALRTLGHRMDPFVLAVDPRWRDTHAPYGSTAVFVEKAAAAAGEALSGTGPLGAVIVLRLVAVLSVVALVALTLRLLPGRGDSQRIALVLALLAANPVTAVHLVGGAHLDALAATLTVAALVVERQRSGRQRSGRQRTDRNRQRSDQEQPGHGRPHRSRWSCWSHWSLRSGALRCGGVALACLAGTVKATAFLALAVVVLVHLLERVTASHGGNGDRSRDGNGDGSGKASTRRRAMVAAGAGTLLFDLSVAAVTMTLSMVAAGFGPTWIGALSTSGQSQTGIAPASLLAHLIRLPLGLLGAGDQSQTALAVSRGLSLAVAAAVVARLLRRAWRRPSVPQASAQRPTLDDIAIAGVGGMAVALGTPVVYPWYLAPAVPALAVMAATSGSPVVRRLVVVTSVVLCVTSLASLAPTWTLLGRAAPPASATMIVAAVVGAVAVGVTALAVTSARPRGRRPSRR
ncbi:polyprenol phosphomannose-dependent alpha 1,6 mannosyltransferase MptB [Protofrankia symbiont of Coriaria ruscifolia]|uniref:polyprenol phosphomannose-dependent alpha 1,6 mannosyltransferase MptB n=1 Tax=Protofrankia symbiont of Coriaria ruscifolia TaxID=1306542 RepID=UPI001A947B5C|nr:polyprenol phosphomannose-dependent alpha 1,6 mannosyltransferase MptB [Protofrankia symbiont of Coriaria ruscifolia]